MTYGALVSSSSSLPLDLRTTRLYMNTYRCLLLASDSCRSQDEDTLDKDLTMLYSFPIHSTEYEFPMYDSTFYNTHLPKHRKEKH